MLELTEQMEQIRVLLGRPAYEAQGVAIYNGDCLQLMKKLPPQLLDLTVTSPPYNIGKEYEAVVERGHYLDWCEAWIEQVYRLTKPTGAFWLNLGYFAVDGKAACLPIPYLLWDRVPFFLLQEIVWNYGAGVACRKLFSPRNEKFLWYVKDASSYVFNLDAVRDPDVKYPNQKKNGKLKCNPLGKNPTDVWRFPKVTSGQNRSSDERTKHPAQFPTAVVDRIIKSTSSPGDLVLDPFMGSGTTAEVAIRNGRNVVGFEIRSDYLEIATKRLDRVFLEREHGGVQEHLF